MIEIKIDDEIYTEKQYKRDLTRFFDTYRNKNSEYMGSSNCNDVVCMDCPLREEPFTSVCSVSKAESFDLIKFVYNWAKRHPAVTNRDVLKKTFGEDVCVRIFELDWFDQEYKKPKGESEE